MAAPLEPVVIAFLAAARVAYLATVGRGGAPLVLPVCFVVLDASGPDARLIVSLDEKPKRKPPRELERVRNLVANPRVAVVADRWSEDWTRLAWVHLSGTARVLEPPLGAGADPAAVAPAPPNAAAAALPPDAALHQRAVALLREKYAPYRAMALESRPAIVMEIERVKTWGPLA